MIKWVDIVSPNLRSIHQQWIGLRGQQLFPDLTAYQAFAGDLSISERHDQSFSAVLPPDKSGPVLRHVGRWLAVLYPRCSAGQRVNDISPATLRSGIILPLNRVALSRQPECRRGQAHENAARKDYEVLLLPFGQNGLNVQVIHAVFDFARTAAKEHVQ